MNTLEQIKPKQYSFAQGYIMSYLERIIKSCCEYINILNSYLDEGVKNAEILLQIEYYMEYARKLLITSLRIKNKTNGLISDYLSRIEYQERIKL